MKWLSCLCFCAVVIVIALVVAPYFVDWNARYGKYVFEQLGNSTARSGVTIRAIGGIRGSFLLPKIVVDNLYMECGEGALECTGVLSVDKLELKISPLSLLGSVPKVEVMGVYGLRSSFKTFAGVVLSQTKSKVKEVRIFNAALSSKGVGSVHDGQVRIKKGVVVSSNTESVANAELRVGEHEYKLASRLTLNREENEVKVQADSKNTSVSFIGSSKGGRVLDGLNGKFSIKARDLAEFARDVAIMSSVPVLRSVTSAKVFELSADVEAAGSGFRVSDLRVNAEDVLGKADVDCGGTGSFCDVVVRFEKIDLDALFGEGERAGDVYAANNHTFSNFVVPVSNTVDAKVDLQIKEINYRSNLSKNMVAAIEVKEGKVSVNKFALDLPGRGNHMSISGATGGFGLVPKFVGVIKVQGEDVDALVGWLLPVRVRPGREKLGKFFLESGFYAAPRVFSLSNINMTTDDMGFRGSVKCKYGRRDHAIIGNVSIYNLDFGRYSFSEDFDIKRDLMQFTWLKDLGYSAKVRVELKDSVVGTNVLQNLSLLADFSDGRASVEKIRFNASDGSNLRGRVMVTLSNQGVRPRVVVNLNSDKYGDKFLWLPQFIKGSVQGTDAGSKHKEEKVANRVRWSDEAIDFLGLDGFDGNIEVRVGTLLLGKQDISDLVLLSSLKDGVMSIDKLEWRYGKGSVYVSGNMGMEEVASLSAVISVSDVAFEGVTRSDLNIRGNVSVSGSVQTQGKSFVEWANALQGKMKFAARGVVLQGVDFNSFIRDLFSVENKSDVASLAQVYLYKGSTFFNKFDGEAEIERGIFASSLKFNIDNATGVASVNFSLAQFMITSLFRFFFIPPGEVSPLHIDMNLQGYMWQPNFAFDISALYDLVRRVHALS